MTIEEFNGKYASKGGFTALNMMRNDLRTRKFIAEHFGVTPTAVGDWVRELFGVEYDPRLLRKERIIESMLKFATTHDEKEFREAYYFISKDYFDIALAEAYVRGIYKEQDNGKS